jgi:hypothetical protein
MVFTFKKLFSVSLDVEDTIKLSLIAYMIIIALMGHCCNYFLRIISNPKRIIPTKKTGVITGYKKMAGDFFPKLAQDSGASKVKEIGVAGKRKCFKKTW